LCARPATSPKGEIRHSVRMSIPMR
jgi:hypothetical protein